MSKYDHTPDKEMHKRYDYLDNMDTDKLEALLQLESFLSNDSKHDVKLIRHIMGILGMREPILTDLDVEASLKAFREEVIPDLDPDEIRSPEQPPSI